MYVVCGYIIYKHGCFSLNNLSYFLFLKIHFLKYFFYLFQNAVFVFDEMDWLQYTILSIRMRTGGLLIK